MHLHEGQLEPVARGAEDCPDTLAVVWIWLGIARAVESSSVHVESTPAGCNKKETAEAWKGWHLKKQQKSLTETEHLVIKKTFLLVSFFFSSLMYLLRCWPKSQMATEEVQNQEAE